jgi:hypothetical protein
MPENKNESMTVIIIKTNGFWFMYVSIGSIKDRFG